MAAAFHELPLALFTTLASIGAGAFITLTVAFFTTKFDDEVLARIDKLALVPAIFVIVGFINNILGFIKINLMEWNILFNFRKNNIKKRFCLLIKMAF